MLERISTGELSHINFEKVGPPVLGWSTAFRILPVILELRTPMPCRRLNSTLHCSLCYIWSIISDFYSVFDDILLDSGWKLARISGIIWKLALNTSPCS